MKHRNLRVSHEIPGAIVIICNSLSLNVTVTSSMVATGNLHYTQGSYPHEKHNSFVLSRRSHTELIPHSSSSAFEGN